MATINGGQKSVDTNGDKGGRGGKRGAHYAGGNPHFDETVVPGEKHHIGGNPRFDETTPSGTPKPSETAPPK